MAVALQQFVLDVPPSPAHGSRKATFDLLLACCANQNAPKQIEQALRSSIDWDLLAQSASHHGVLPLVFNRLLAHTKHIPARAVTNLKRMELVNSRRSLWLTNELLRIAEHFKKHEIRFLAYKGPTLSQTLYGRVTARQFGDLDILVHPNDVSNALDSVRALGYRSQLALTPAQEQAYRSIGYEYAFDSDLGRHLLEIKWQILPRFYAIDFDVEKMFAAAGSVEIGACKMTTLSAEDLLLILCVHAAKHTWEKLSWLCDVAALADSVQLDWNRLQARVGAMGIQRILAVHFSLAHRLLGAPIPVFVSAYIEKDSTVELLVEKTSADIVDCKNLDPDGFSYFAGFAKLRERRADRARFWWRLLTTPGVGEWKSAKIGNPLSPLYRGVRLYRLGKRMLRAAF